MKLINIIVKKLLTISCKLSAILSAFRKLTAISYKLTATKGFTLVEMLVAVATFMIVMLIATGSLASIIDGNNKAQSLKSAINNLNFALESMGKNIRVGTVYSNASLIAGCSDNKCISFTSYKGESVMYRWNGTDSLERCVSLTLTCSNSSTFTRMTAKEVKITDMKFYLEESLKPSRVLITVSGEAGTKERLKTKFNLQTTVAQRTIQ